MEVTSQNFSTVLNRARILQIPFFQRAYVWEEPQWRRFLDDMEFLSTSDEPYFFGSLILKKKPAFADTCDVIDGQQRLTTLAVFFKVWSLKDPQAAFLAKRYTLDENGEIALEHNRINRESFERILNLQTEEEIELQDGKKDNIIMLYDFFRKNIELEKLNYKGLGTKIDFAVLTLSERDNEQRIFDTINSLGVPLTTAELLKNYLFNRENIGLYENNWQKVFEADDECRQYWDKTIVTGRLERPLSHLFFNAFLQIKIQDSSLGLKSDEKRKLVRVDGLFNSYMQYVELSKIDKSLLTEEIKKYAKTFHQYFKIDALDRDLSCSADPMDRINAIIFRLENSTLIPYVLYVLQNAPEEERNGIFEYLETYILRRIICRSSNKNYNQFFGERLISNQVLTKDKLIESLNIDGDLTIAMPNDDELKKGIFESVLINKQAAGILYMIESKIRDTALQSTGLYGIGKYSLEHIMPKNWRKNWNKLDASAAGERDRMLLTLGNLAIISNPLNNVIRDSSWNVKLNGDGKNKGLKFYAAGLETFSSEHMNLPEWNEETIKSRAEFLYEKAAEIWPIQ